MRRLFRPIAIALLSLISLGAAPLPTDINALPVLAHPALPSFRSLPVSFEVNRGQDATEIRFIAHAPRFTALLTRGGVTMVPDATCAGHTSGNGVSFKYGRTPVCAATAAGVSTSVQLSFPGATPVSVTGRGELPGTVNYFLGNDPRRWRTDIPTYRQVAYRSVYPKIDQLWYTSGSGIEYDWMVHPGADPERIREVITGGTPVIDPHGDLVLHLMGGSLVQHHPQVYQLIEGRRHAVAGRFRLAAGRRISFALGRYDKRRTLIIDPALTYSVDLGGSDGSRGLGIAVDGAGNSYVAGATESSNFPTVRPLQTRARGDEDVFVAKLNPSGTQLLYSTYIGGHRNDQGIAIAVDSGGSAYVTGETLSDDYPLVHPLQDANRSTCTANGGRVPCDDVLISKLNPAGDALLYSTYLGGDGADEGYGIAVDHSGRAYVAGRTDSDNFPVHAPLQRHIASQICLSPSGTVIACSDAFVARLSPSGAALEYGTYLGGKSDDEADGIAVDRHDNAYVVGTTYSADFPLAHALQPHRNGPYDGFVADVNSSGARLVYGTYLGGTRGDAALNVTVRAGSAYVSGYTYSHDFPLAHPLQSTSRGLDVFVTKLLPQGKGLAYSTYLGGSGDDEALGIAVDRRGNAYITGDTDSRDFPTVNAVQPANGGGNDAILVELSASGTRLLQSTYLGGKNQDYGDGVAVDTAGNGYITGFTFSANFPSVHGVPGVEGTGAFIAGFAP